MLTTHEQHSRAKLVATVLSVLVVAGVVVIADQIKSKSPSVNTVSSNITAPASGTSGGTIPTNSPTTTNSSTASGSFTDGTFSATNDYFVPSGEQSIEVSATLNSGVITSVSIQNSESDPTSAEFQQDFASQYKSYVIGQKISSLHLSVVAGASDTTQGFSDALSQIANKAKA